MGRFIGGVVAVAALAAALTWAYVADVPFSNLLGSGAGLACLVWLLLIITVPWNLYFKAKTVAAEIRISRSKGIEVSEERSEEAERIARAMRTTAVGAHLVTALVAIGFAMATGKNVGYWFAIFTAVATVFRPAGAYFAQLGRRLSALTRDVTHPRDDVAEVKAKVEFTMEALTKLTTDHGNLVKAFEMQRQQSGEMRNTMLAEYAAFDEKVNKLGVEFESAILKVTDNAEIITGVRAFLALLREENSKG